MQQRIKKELIEDIAKALEVLEGKAPVSALRDLSNHSIADVAAYKDIDIVSMTVLLYSLFKVYHKFDGGMKNLLAKSFYTARNGLEEGNLGKYNAAVKELFKLVREGDARVKDHLRDVLEAARIKKGTILYEHGLSIGQAAGLMGLSNWDLQAYAGSHMRYDPAHERVAAKDRLALALKLFGVNQ